MSADRPGEPPRMLGARRPAIAIGSTGSGHVPAAVAGWTAGPFSAVAAGL